MEVETGLFEKLRLGSKLVHHKLLQYRLTTCEKVELNTKDGRVRGVKRMNLYNENRSPLYYYAFEGIPYAQPPLGELRFRAPSPPKPWQGVRDCTRCAPKPMQRHIVLGITEGSENCLYLNVYAKQLKSEKRLPVLVWIYGGGFQVGEASRDFYGPDYFMREDVVLVTIAYRLGALGFLSLDDPDIGVPGNAGLKDQLMALRWIAANIAEFNGDPINITLFGESAGAASVHAMMIAEKARGLFHKAILQSGSVLCPWAQTPKANWGFRLASSLGYEGTDNDKEICRFLMKANAAKIVAHDNCLRTKDEQLQHLLFAFGPVVEPYQGEDSLLVRPFVELMRTAWSNEIPVIIGGTSFEGLFSYQSAKYLLEDLGDCECLVPLDVKENKNAAEIKELALSLKRLHFGQTEPSCKESLFQYLDLVSYKFCWHGLHRTLRSRLAYASPDAPTYLYRFDFDSPDFNHYRILKCGHGVRGVSHADDLSYLFHNIASCKLPTTTPEFRTIERMVGMWTSFASTSNPNCDRIKPAVWRPVESDGQVDNTVPLCLNISDVVYFIELPESEKLKVWDGLYQRNELF